MNEKNRLLTDSVSSLMRSYCLPCIFSLLIAALYNIVDQIFIANAPALGSFGNAANTAVFPITVLALAFGVWIGDGACAGCASSLGKGDRQEASTYAGNALWMLGVCAVLLTAACFVFSAPLLNLFGGAVNETTWKLTNEYFFWIRLGLPFYIIGQGLNPIIRADGSPKYAMLVSLAGALVNLILDPLFIYGMNWGMTGAAIATILGQILTFALSAGYLFHLKSFGINIHFAAGVERSILTLGMTSFLAQISMVISMAAVQNRIIFYGLQDPVFSSSQLSQIPLAVLGIVMKFFQIIISIAIGLAAGLLPVVSYNMGGKRMDRVLAFFKALLVSELILGICGLILIEGIPQILIGIFGSGSESPVYLEFGVLCFRIYLCMLPLATVNKGCFIFLQAMGKGMESACLSFFREIICGVGLPILLPIWFGLNGVLYSFPCADALTFVLSGVVIVSIFRSLQPRKLKGKAVEVTA